MKAGQGFEQVFLLRGGNGLAFFGTHFEIGIPQIQRHKGRQPETVGIELLAGFEHGRGTAAHFGVNQFGQFGHI